MEKYWKLLDIENETYSTHETEEEVNHIIEYNTRHLSDDKVTKRINIETPFSNYDFQFVYVFDEHHIHKFLYFFDTIEEEHDDFEERIIDLSNQLDEITKQRDNAINLLNKKTTDIFNANRIIDKLQKQIHDLEFNVTSFDFSSSYPKVLISEKYPMMKGKFIDGLTYEKFMEYMDREDCCVFTDDPERSELIKSLRNRILVLEAGIKESERNEEFWKSQYEKYKKFVNGIHKQSADFMYSDDDDFPF